MTWILLTLTLAITTTAQAMTTHPPATDGMGGVTGEAAIVAGTSVAPAQTNERTHPRWSPQQSTSSAKVHTTKAIKGNGR